MIAGGERNHQIETKKKRENLPLAIATGVTLN